MTRWIKSSRSASQAQCVEARAEGAQILIRDSKLKDDSPILRLSHVDAEAFLTELKASRLDG